MPGCARDEELLSIMSKRCRRKLIKEDDEEKPGGESESKSLMIFQKQSPPSCNTPQNEDSIDEEIFSIKRFKISDTVEIEKNKNSIEYRAQDVNLSKEIQPTDIRKPKHIMNKHATSIIITNTGKLHNKAKTGLRYSKNNDVRNRVEAIEQKETIYLSPSTGKTCQVLQNVTFPSSSAPTTPRHQIKKQNKNSSSLCSPSLGFRHIVSESRASSLSEISRSNLLDCDLSLNEENLKELLKTPEQKRSSKKYMSEFAVIDDSNLSTCAEKREIEVSVIAENVSKDVDRKQQNRDNIEDVSDNGDDKDYSPSNDNSSDSEGSDNYSLEVCIDEEQELEDENEDTENETLDAEEALPDRQTNKNDDDAWEDILESPLNFDEFVGENTYNIPPFVKSPEDVYKLFVTDEMINKMALETNNYAQNYLRTNQQNMKRKSRMKEWTNTSFQEMKTFLAVVMAMGLCKVPHINLYWSKNKLYRNEFIRSAMTRDRFLLLLKCWHVSDVSNDDKTDKLHKIRDMLSMITDKFQNILNPGKYVVIDETMIPWRGRLGFRQYIKTNLTDMALSCTNFAPPKVIPTK
ncbi:unnamed protein product [Parnassius mnemosyne]|uniref:PiggyBac transposable element-derived protein domain-containing protein n=1 Tax=Parnassius mnemosyne TaxID=213953 RepID=A0AAV1L6R2_9NEOP